MSRVTVKDNGAAKLIAQARELAKGATVRVGVLDDATKQVEPGEEPSKLSLLEVAAVHEFGAPAAGIPQRSFIRATIDARRADIARLQLALAKQVLTGKLTPDQALEQMGAKVAAWCQTRIAEGIGPALKPATIARKKSSKPLVDTGQLKSAITYRVTGG
jgi:phage gpG-like protein